MKPACFANTILKGSIGVCGFLLYYSISRDSLVLYQIILAILMTVLALSLKIPANYRVNLFLALVSTGFTLLAADVSLAVVENSGDIFGHHVAAAARAKIQFDARTPL